MLGGLKWHQVNSVFHETQSVGSKLNLGVTQAAIGFIDCYLPLICQAAIILMLPCVLCSGVTHSLLLRP
jgi:hypothetical protein